MLGTAAIVVVVVVASKRGELRLARSLGFFFSSVGPGPFAAGDARTSNAFLLFAVLLKMKRTFPVHLHCFQVGPPGATAVDRGAAGNLFASCVDRVRRERKIVKYSGRGTDPVQRPNGSVLAATTSRSVIRAHRGRIAAQRARVYARRYGFERARTDACIFMNVGFVSVRGRICSAVISGSDCV